jgi:hypothetical protein
MITKYVLTAGCVLMGISFFLPWVTVGNMLSGYDLAEMYSRINDKDLYLRFATVPKVALGILIFYFANAPKNLIYYSAPVFSLIPLVVLDGDIFQYDEVLYGFYLLHISVILIWIGAFTYKYQSDPLVKSPAKL